MSAPHKFVAPLLPTPTHWHDPATPRSMIGGPWLIDPNYRATLHLKNDVQTSPLPVTPVLYLANGAKYALPEIKLEPAGTATIDLNAALAQLGIASWAELFGYIEIQYNWPWDALCATVRDVDSVHSEQFTYGLGSIAASRPKGSHGPAVAPAVEGLWWKQEPNVTGFLAVSNVTGDSREVSIQVTNRTANPTGEHSITLSPHATKLIQLDELKSATTPDGGLRVSWAGNPGDIVANGGLEDQSVGYSADIPFTELVPDPSNMGPRRYAEVGLMTGPADPMMQFPAGTTFTPYSLLRNVSNQPITVSAKLYWMQAGAPRSAKLPAITVPPQDSAALDMASALKSAGLSNFSGSLNVILDVQGPRYAFLADSGSVDKKNTYVFGVQPSAVLESMAKSLSYWGTVNGDDTMVSIWNPADEAQDFVFTLFFSGGKYDLPLHLEGKATRSFNVSEIIANQTPDAQGRTIPLSVHEGSALLTGSQGESEHILVSYESGTYNVQKATCGTHYCKTCPGAVSSFVDADPWSLAVQNSTQESFVAQSNTGHQVNDSGGASWNSSNTSIATVNTGMVAGQSPGGTEVNAYDESFADYTDACYSYVVECPVATGISGSSPGTVQPKIAWTSNPGADIAGTNQSVVVGQQISLTASPGGGSWTIKSGSAVGGFSTGASGGPLTLIASNNPSILFYWYVGGSGSVSYSANGQSAGLSFSIAAPTYSGITVVPSTVYLEPPAPSVPSWMSLGTYPSGTTAGMYFTGNITPPSGYSGTLQWVQIINNMSEWFYFTNGSQQDCSGSNALDNTYPYGNSQSPTQSQAFTNDSPGVGLPSQSYEIVQRADNFSMYLMWQPNLSNAIFVPIGVVSWSWGGTAYFQSGTWVLHSATEPTYSATSTSNWPSWASTILNASTPCGEPYHGRDLEMTKSGSGLR